MRLRASPAAGVHKEKVRAKVKVVFVMLLAASLIGISSAINYQPEVTIAQPQPTNNK